MTVTHESNESAIPPSTKFIKRSLSSTSLSANSSSGDISSSSLPKKKHKFSEAPQFTTSKSLNSNLQDKKENLSSGSKAGDSSDTGRPNYTSLTIPNLQQFVAKQRPTHIPHHNMNARILIVRNVPFQASREEIHKLFEPVDGLVEVRLPKKATGGHRGFAFVEFLSAAQAKAAMEAFSGDTHFFGRRLVMDFAQEN
ncbi:unnamed protein product [Protopolystoma xenopodis]|uniref:RRM domain-containing protein n=1 Tax=Protopolystoma xenopodis TaxID=117903 RepID=A0A448XG77_9PLAT|nr:unnamed protein product [Protopolystoma xenopodis]